ncbi:MAG: hypothetical protein ACQEQ0_14310, partial [Bacteroidota bacterium]
TYLAGKEMRIEIGKPVRYLRFRSFPQRVTEIEAMASGKKLARSEWRASNVFDYSKKARKAWKTNITLDEVPDNSYLCIALKGKHGAQGAYAAAKIDGKLVGAPDRAPSFLSNPWEGFNSRRDKNYTYYIPVSEKHKGKNIELFVMGYDQDNLDFKPEAWISAYPYPWKKVKLSLKKNE